MPFAKYQATMDKLTKEYLDGAGIPSEKRCKSLRSNTTTISAIPLLLFNAKENDTSVLNKRKNKLKESLEYENADDAARTGNNSRQI